MLLPGLTLEDIWPAWDEPDWTSYLRDGEIPEVDMIKPEAYMGAHW